MNVGVQIVGFVGKGYRRSIFVGEIVFALNTY